MLTCKNNKNYKLTVGKQYHTEEDGEYVLLINDNGRRQRYHKELFQEVEVAAPEPEIVRTEATCIESLSFNDDGEVSYEEINGNLNTINIDILQSSSTDISCGVYQIYNINTLIDQIEEGVNTEDDDLITLKQTIFKTTLENRINGINCAFVILSTNIDNQYEDYYNTLNEMSEVRTESKRNPNSGNQIVVWTIPKN
jgi:hypothetical protein